MHLNWPYMKAPVCLYFPSCLSLLSDLHPEFRFGALAGKTTAVVMLLLFEHSHLQYVFLFHYFRSNIVTSVFRLDLHKL